MSLLATVVCALVAGPPAGPTERPPEASSLVQVELVSLEGDIWGGDGDGIPAVFHIFLTVTVRNDSEGPVRLDHAVWSMPLEDEMLAGSSKGLPLEVPPGEIVALRFEPYLSYEQVRRLDEGVRSMDERQVRAISGRVDFTTRGDARYAVFTVRGHWRGATDPPG